MSAIPGADLLEQLGSIKWVGVLLLVALATNGLAKLGDSIRRINGWFRDFRTHHSGRKLSDAQLASRSREVSRAIMELVMTRRLGEPQIDFDNWQASTHAMSRHSADTQDLYARDYAGVVGYLRDEFLKRGLQDPELDSGHEHPTNVLGLRDVAIALGRLAERLLPSRV